MEHHGLLIARSVHSVSVGKEESLVRIRNPSQGLVTVYRDERLGILQPLEPALESTALEETKPGSPPNSTERLGQVIRQLQSRVQGLSEAEDKALETHYCFNFLMLSPSTVMTWAGPVWCVTRSILRLLLLSSNHLGGYHSINGRQLGRCWMTCCSKNQHLGLGHHPLY